MESVYRSERVKSESNEDQVHANPITQTALDYAVRGIPVFPLKGKVPLTKHGFKDASADSGEVARMFDPEMNATGIGMPTGSVSGYVVVDRDGDSEEAQRIWSSLPLTLEVATARGIHRYYRAPEGVVVKGRKMGPDVDLKADGGYVLTPGSLHPSGVRYAEVEETKVYGVAEFPAHLLKAETQTANSGPVNSSPRYIDDGAPIPDGSRNKTLTSIAGRLHDSSRDLDQLTSDLMAMNLQRCTPPLDADEVAKIAGSIHRKTPCRPTPRSTPEVLEVIKTLRTAAARRAVKGMSGATGWSIYHAGLDLLTKYGQTHPDGVAMDVDFRTWSLNAGTAHGTVSKFVKRTPLVRLEKRGTGRSRSRVVFVVPTGVKRKHSSTVGGFQKYETSSSVSSRPLFRTLYRLRWGVGRINKSRAALLAAVVECPDSRRCELAEALGRTPDSLKKPLKWLLDNGLLLRTGHGRYRVPEDFERRIEDARELAGEPLADRLQMQRHERQRESYRKHSRRDRTPDEATGPTEEGTQNVQASREARAAYQPPPHQPTSEQTKRIAKLVREGMRRDFAEEAVLRRGHTPKGKK